MQLSNTILIFVTPYVKKFLKEIRYSGVVYFRSCLEILLVFMD